MFNMPKPFLKSDFRAAVLGRSPFIAHWLRQLIDFRTTLRLLEGRLGDPNSGRVYTGTDHLAALQTAEDDGNHNLGQENTGFQHKDGTFYTRTETDKEWGFMTSEEL